MTENTLAAAARLLGQREAFGLVAGRCSAAEATCLRDLREGKQYLAMSETWEDFCLQHLHMARTSADRIIRLLDEFGPGYFELAQLVRIPPDAYRSIAPAMKDGLLHVDGEDIALIPENAAKVAAAVAALREKMPQPAVSPKALDKRLAPLKRRATEVFEELREIYRSGPSDADRELLNSTVQELTVALIHVKLDQAA